MVIKIFLLNVFADGLFSGVRVGGVILRHLGQEAFLQALATELNLSAIVYILPINGEFMVRYFSPEQEVNENGHGTLAAGHVIYSCGLAPPDQPICLHSRAGRRKVFQQHYYKGSTQLGLVLGQMAIQPQITPEIKQGMVGIMGISQAEQLTLFKLTNDHLVVCGCNEKVLDAIQQDALQKLGPEISALTVSAPIYGSSGYTVRRFPAPETDAEELPNLDLHKILAPYWAKTLKKSVLDIHYQTKRTYRLWAQINSEAQVVISGQVNTIFRADPIMDELRSNFLPDTTPDIS